MKALGVVTVLSSSAAFAAAHPRVDVAIDSCIVAGDEVRRVVQIELGDLFSDETISAHTHASAQCAGAFTSLRVDDPLTGRSLARSIDLSAVMPASRPRLVALALVELVASSWTELEPAVVAPSLVASSETFAPEPPSPSHVRVALTGGGLRFSDMHVLQGAGLRVADGSQRRIGWMVDAHVTSNKQAVTLGTVESKDIDIGVAAELHVRLSHVRLDAGAGVRGGEVRMGGVPQMDTLLDSNAFWAQWFGIFAEGHAGLPITDHVTLDAIVETGYVLVPVSGLVDGHRGVAVDGAWIAGHIGIGVSL